MQKVTLGHSKIEISNMGFGHCDFGTKVDKETAFRVLDAFVDAGGNFIDTSNNYALWNPGGKGGECETIIGEWMASRKNRDKIVLATKVGANVKDVSKVKHPDGSFFDDWFLHGEGLSKKAITEAIEGSLKRLQTDYIDLYYSHVEDPEVEVLETLSTFDKLHKEGKIRAIGCSNHTAWRLERAMQISKQHKLISYCCTQDLHTYLTPLASKRPIFANYDKLDYVRRNPDIKLIAYTPTLWGKYAQKENYTQKEHWLEFYTTETEKKLSLLSELAKKHNASEIQIVYAWIMQSEPSAVPLITTKSVDHLKENVAACDIKLGQDELTKLNNI